MWAEVFLRNSCLRKMYVCMHARMDVYFVAGDCAVCGLSSTWKEAGAFQRRR